MGLWGLFFLIPTLFFSLISKVRPEPIRGRLVESTSLSLSLPVCFSLEPSLIALSLCHLTALSPNKAIKGTLNASPRKEKASWKLKLQCRRTMKAHSIPVKRLSTQFHYMMKIPDGQHFMLAIIHNFSFFGTWVLYIFLLLQIVTNCCVCRLTLLFLCWRQVLYRKGQWLLKQGVVALAGSGTTMFKCDNLPNNFSNSCTEVIPSYFSCQCSESTMPLL